MGQSRSSSDRAPPAHSHRVTTQRRGDEEAAVAGARGRPGGGPRMAVARVGLLRTDHAAAVAQDMDRLLQSERGLAVQQARLEQQVRGALVRYVCCGLLVVCMGHALLERDQGRCTLLPSVVVQARGLHIPRSEAFLPTA